MKDYVDPLEVLETRIKTMENRVFGNVKRVDVKTSVMDSLMVINSQIVCALTGREQITNVLKRLNELEKYMDPNYGDEAPLTAKAKVEVILSMEAELERNMKYIQQLQQLKSVFESEHIKNVPALQNKLDELTVIELENKERFDNASKEIHNMIQNYNDIVTTLSKSFVQWDAVVTKCEMESQVKKNVE